MPRPLPLRGRSVDLEPLDVDRHSNSLWQAVRGHDELWSWMADGPYRSLAAFRHALQRKQQAPDALFLAIVPRATGAAEGYACFMRIEPAHGVLEVGNILMAPRLQRTTAATEAMYLMARHVFEDLHYRRYEWKCNALNEPSRHAALRLGFRFEGIFSRHMVVKGANRDTAWFAMLDRDWPLQKKAFEAWLDPANFRADGRQRRRLGYLRRLCARNAFA